MHEGQGLRRQTEINWMTDPFYRAEPDDAPEDASVRYSVIAGILAGVPASTDRLSKDDSRCHSAAIASMLG
jgi:hypothetical protein